MSTYRHKGSPFYHYDFQFRGQRFHGSTGCDTKRAADEYERRERQKAALPEQRRPPITLDEACGLYQDQVETKPSWPTIRYIISALIAGIGKNRLLSSITQRDLQVHFARRRAKPDGSRSNASINREVENARAIWRLADRTRYDVGEMPDWKALRLKVPRTAPRELEAASEEARLFRHLREDVRDAVDFLLKSGWRRAEVLGLRWAEVNFPAKTATTKIKGGDTVVRPLTTALVELLARQPQAGPFVFTYICQQSRAKRRKGERYPLTPTALRKPFAQALSAAKIDNFRIHDLRHTRGTRIVRATGSLAAAKKALEHRSLSTTLRYAHVLDEDVRNALEASDAAPKSRNSPEVPKTKGKKA